MVDRSGSRYGRLAECCEHSNEPSGFVKCPEFLGWLKIFQFLTKDPAPCSGSFCHTL